jgi:chaperonin GroES
MTVRAVGSNLIIHPLFPPDKIGHIFIPEQAKDRCKQGIVKQIGPDCKLDVKLNDHVFFSAYSGTLFQIDGETCIIMEEDKVEAVLSEVHNVEIPGLYFRDSEGLEFACNYNIAIGFIARAIENSKWWEGIKVKQPKI